MMERKLALNVYSYDEIIRRIIDGSSPVSGPTGYMVEINFIAPNDCEPPIVTAYITENRKDVICNISVDQNTTLEHFEFELRRWNEDAELCRKASDNRTSYREQIKYIKSKSEACADMPF